MSLGEKVIRAGGAGGVIGGDGDLAGISTASAREIGDASLTGGSVGFAGMCQSSASVSAGEKYLEERPAGDRELLSHSASAISRLGRRSLMSES